MEEALIREAKQWRGGIESIFRRRIGILNRILFDYVGRRADGRRFDGFVDTLVEVVLKTSRVRLEHDVVADSLTDVTDEPLTKRQLFDLCWRIAGNLHHLKAGTPVPPWCRQLWPELCPVQVLRVQPSRNPRTKAPGWTMRLQFLGGTPCPLTTDRFWSRDLFADYAVNYFGFSRYRHRQRDEDVQYPFQHPLEFTTLRFLALVDPVLSDTKPRFRELAFTPGIRSYNRERHRWRARIDEQHACPFKFEHPCWQCGKGFKTCPAGAHPLDYEYRLCGECNNPRAAFDPDFPDRTRCVNCFRKWVRSRKD